jgi:hypothetical protein
MCSRKIILIIKAKKRLLNKKARIRTDQGKNVMVSRNIDIKVFIVLQIKMSTIPTKPELRIVQRIFEPLSIKTVFCSIPSMRKKKI